MLVSGKVVDVPHERVGCVTAEPGLRVDRPDLDPELLDGSFC
jgi:hypothetical protein